MHELKRYFSAGFLVLVLVSLLIGFIAVTSSGAGITSGVLFAVVITLPLLLARWVYLDAERRKISAWTWGLLTYLFTIVGLIIYLAGRSKHPVDPDRPDRPAKRHN